MSAAAIISSGVAPPSTEGRGTFMRRGERRALQPGVLRGVLAAGWNAVDNARVAKGKINFMVAK